MANYFLLKFPHFSVCFVDAVFALLNLTLVGYLFSASVKICPLWNVSQKMGSTLRRSSCFDSSFLFSLGGTLDKGDFPLRRCLLPI